jgi:uncharacterized protein (TIGR00730 family)
MEGEQTGSIGTLCVFCGSSRGRRIEHTQAAARLGRSAALRGIRLVTGGGHVGLMGVLADAALEAGGSVTGVIPRDLQERELAHGGLTELIVTGSMHERKATMAERSDAFVALPGGWGTLDETFEILTWAQLGLHVKPVGILDVAGFYQPLLELMDALVAEGFLPPDQRAALTVRDDPEALLDVLGRGRMPTTAKWEPGDGDMGRSGAPTPPVP